MTSNGPCKCLFIPKLFNNLICINDCSYILLRQRHNWISLRWDLLYLTIKYNLIHKESGGCLYEETVATAFVRFTAGFTVRGCGKAFQSTLIPQGEVAKMQYDLLLLASAIMVGVVLVVTIIFLYVIVRFRQKERSGRLYSRASWRESQARNYMDSYSDYSFTNLSCSNSYIYIQTCWCKCDGEKNIDKDTIVVDVTANLYWWEFSYKSEKIVTSQDLVIPTGKKCI